jgi:hypothetical protein
MEFSVREFYHAKGRAPDWLERATRSCCVKYAAAAGGGRMADGEAGCLAEVAA